MWIDGENGGRESGREEEVETNLFFKIIDLSFGFFDLCFVNHSLCKKEVTSITK